MRVHEIGNSALLCSANFEGATVGAQRRPVLTDRLMHGAQIVMQLGILGLVGKSALVRMPSLGRGLKS